MAFKYGGSSFGFLWDEGAEAMMNRLARHGFRDFDIFLTPPHFWPADMTSGERSALRQRLESNGLRIESVNFPNYDYNQVGFTDEQRRFATALLLQQVPLLEELGVKRYIVIPGRIGISSPPKPVLTGWLRQSFDALLPLAERHGVEIVIENIPNAALPLSTDVAEFCAAYDHPKLKTVYDAANAEFVGDDHAAALKRLQPWLVQLHLSDCTRTRWAHDVIGTGTVDFATIGRTLAEIGFDQIVINEVRGEPREEAVVDSQRVLAERFGWPALI